MVRIEKKANEVLRRSEKKANEVLTRSEKKANEVLTRNEKKANEVMTRNEKKANEVLTRSVKKANEVLTRIEEKANEDMTHLVPIEESPTRALYRWKKQQIDNGTEQQSNKARQVLIEKQQSETGTDQKNNLARIVVNRVALREVNRVNSGWASYGSTPYTCDCLQITHNEFAHSHVNNSTIISN